MDKLELKALGKLNLGTGYSGTDVRMDITRCGW